MSGVGGVTDRTVSRLVAALGPQIKSLELRGCDRVTTCGVASVLTNCTAMENLDLTGEFKVRIRIKVKKQPFL